ncbi:hypothetical protein LY71_105163 [Geodermatophilus tzadiensis]|uniref:Uncharacterized protein n=1 Tax=Geodermatophilus tzadiensis TaxID=1137988 RepID=A0A2T0TVM9_9ACTN|nr:hypothetical protein [Geodermatophilus tzadiensis]PRY49719.1 hypothetical protein LY71_105163 [Geodermatophilus tzadiensis]
MGEAELRDLVGWTVEDAPPEARAGRVLGAVLHAVSAVVTLGADAAGGARRPAWTVPADPAAYLDLGAVRLHWPPSAPGEAVAASRVGVWALAPGRPPRALPVEAWRVLRAVPATGSRRPRQAAAPWRLEVGDGTGSGTLTGAWLALAWIGTLAGWPEPTGPGPDGGDRADPHRL